MLVFRFWWNKCFVSSYNGWYLMIVADITFTGVANTQKTNVSLAQNRPLSCNCSNAICLLFVKKVQICVAECIIILSGNSGWHYFVSESTLSLTSFCQGTESEFILSGNWYCCSLPEPVFKYNLNSQICMCGHVSDKHMNGSKQNPV